MTTNAPTIDFAKVDALRKHMLLTRVDMAGLLGVSRATYYGWLAGKPIRKTNDAKVRSVLKQLLHIMTEHSWPTPEVIAAEPKQRRDMLGALLSE